MWKIKGVFQLSEERESDESEMQKGLLIPLSASSFQSVININLILIQKNTPERSSGGVKMDFFRGNSLRPRSREQL